MASDVETPATVPDDELPDDPRSDRCVHFSHTRQSAAGLRVGDVMVRRPKSLPADATIGDVRRMLANPSLLNVLLLDGPTFAGLVEREAVPADADDAASAHSFATVDVPTISEDTRVDAALATMDADQRDRLVVLSADGHTLAGLVCLDHTGDGFCGG